MILVKMLGSTAYFAGSIVLVPFLRDEFGYSDQQAGNLYGVWGFLTSVFGVVCGPVIDYLGIRRALIAGSLFGVVGGILWWIGWLGDITTGAAVAAYLLIAVAVYIMRGQ